MKKEELIKLLVLEKKERHNRTVKALELYRKKLESLAYIEDGKYLLNLYEMNVEERQDYYNFKDYYKVEYGKELCFDVLMGIKDFKEISPDLMIYADVLSYNDNQYYIKFLGRLVPVYSDILSLSSYYQCLKEELTGIIDSLKGLSLKEVQSEYQNMGR